MIDPKALADEIERTWACGSALSGLQQERIIAALRHECPKPDPRAEVALRLLEMVEHEIGLGLRPRAFATQCEYLSHLLREAQKCDEK
jgi:hypothetical protein